MIALISAFLPAGWYLRNRYFLLLDVLLIPLAVYFSYVLRLERFEMLNPWIPGMFLFGGIAMILAPIVFHYSGLYYRFWRYASIGEILLLMGAVMAATLATTIFTVLIGWITTSTVIIPRSIPFIFLLLALPATAGPRLVARVWGWYHSRMNQQGSADAKLIVIIGAGDSGSMIAREIQQNPQLGLRPVGFLDDDRGKHSMVIHGLRVLGDRTAIPLLAAQHGVQQAIIAMPTAPGKQIRAIVGMCESAGIKAKIVPGVYEFLGGSVSFSQVRSVEIEDLLRRAPIRTEIESVRRLVAGKKVMITGAGGSIGSELARQVYQCGPAEIVLLGHGENSIFDIYNELERRNFEQKRNDPDADMPTLRPLIADIRFAERMFAILQEVQPDLVFHAAAHKHVPLMEANMAEAVLNNVLGTRTLVEAAAAAGVEQFVMVSTDKAVNPTSIMGATKRVAELLVHEAARRHNRAYVAVRFGNVLGSRGSVIETFRRQIDSGGPITVTHEEMRRYFITIPEAVQLVLHASMLGHGGEVFVLDMGEPVKIVDLATDLVRLSGLKIGRDIDIVFSGLRPGEKLFEELFTNGEEYRRTEHEQIFIAANASSLVPRNLHQVVDRLCDAAQRSDQAALVECLRSLLPEFNPVGDSIAGVGWQEAPYFPGGEAPVNGMHPERVPSVG